ncbi:MAG: flagellar protein G [Thermoplasmataceae archaeon]
MSSTGISEMIFFIVTLVVTASVVGALAYQTSNLTQGMKNSSTQVSSMLDDNFKIINDPTHIPYKVGTGYTFYIKNIGSQSFYFTNNTVTVMINGTIILNSKLTFNYTGNNGSLLPGEVGQIIVNVSLSPQYYTIRITIYNGLSKQLIFKV